MEGIRRYELGGAGPAGPESAARRARRQRGGEVSIATVYSNVNEHQGSDYWDYDNLQVRWGYVAHFDFLRIAACLRSAILSSPSLRCPRYGVESKCALSFSSNLY